MAQKLLDSLEFYSANITDGAVSHAIEKNYNDARDAAIGSAWQAGLTVLASGFGKGMLAVAALAIAGGALVMGGLAGAGYTLSGWDGGAVTGMLDGATLGGSAGLTFLGTAPGLVALAAGGIGGAYLQGKENQQNIQAEFAHAAERAKQQELEQALSKSITRQKQIEQAVLSGVPAEQTEKPSFSERFAGNRSSRGSESFVSRVSEPNGGLRAAKEIERRAEQELRDSEPGVNYV